MKKLICLVFVIGAGMLQAQQQGWIARGVGTISGQARIGGLPPALLKTVPASLPSPAVPTGTGVISPSPAEIAQQSRVISGDFEFRMVPTPVPPAARVTGKPVIVTP